MAFQGEIPAQSGGRFGPGGRLEENRGAKRPVRKGPGGGTGALQSADPAASA